MLEGYKDYKETPALWIDKIPDDWDSKMVREIFIERRTKVSDKDYPALSVCKAGIVPQLDTAVKTDNGDNRKLVRKCDFIINSRSDRKGASGISPYDGSVSLINIVLKPTTDENLAFLHYLLRSIPFTEEFYRNGRGLVSDLWTTRYSELKNIFLPIPPREQQDKIVCFLDWKISEMKRLISEKKKEIKRLGELKKSIVNQAVTCGLNKNVDMQGIGIEWLPQIPVTWKICYLRQLLTPVSDKSHSNMPLLSITRENGVIMRDIESKESNHNFIPDDLSNYKLLKKGQFGINKMKAWQGSYGVSDYDGIVSPAYYIFDLKFPNKKYFHFAIRSRVYINFFAQASDGIRVGQWDLSMAKMKYIPFFVPPADEQEEILKAVPEKTKEIDSLIKSLKQEISFVQELMSRTISDAVTGKVNVQGVEIPEYKATADEAVDEEIDEEESENNESVDEEVD